jgi:hypothetical protein
MPEDGQPNMAHMTDWDSASEYKWDVTLDRHYYQMKVSRLIHYLNSMTVSVSVPLSIF